MKGIVIEADYVVTCNSTNEIIKDGAIYTENSIIKAIGKRDTITNYYASSKVISGKNKILLPGLVNTHSHSVQTLLRGKAEDLSLIDWLQKVILPGEKGFSADNVYTSCVLGFAEMIRTGTTTCNDMLSAYHSEEGIKAAIDTGIRARIGKMLMDVDIYNKDKKLENISDIINEITSHIKKYHNTQNGRIKYSLNLRFLLNNSVKLISEVVKLQKKYEDILIHTHASENRNESKLVQQQFGKSYIRVLNELNVLGKNTILAHGIWLDEEEYNLIKESDTKISHNPSSNSKLASGIADISKFHELGVVVGLATDGAPCNNNLDMFREMRLATFLQRLKYLNEKKLPAKSVLRMATIDGAKALHMDKEIGSIEIGKKADLILLDIGDTNAIPLYDPITHIVYSASGKDVILTMIDGKIVYENGVYHTVDIEMLKEKVKQYLRS